MKNPQNKLSASVDLRRTHDGLEQISARERTYLLYRYGFIDGDEIPIPEMAAHFHLTKKRTKKTAQSALDVLRSKLLH